MLEITPTLLQEHCKCSSPIFTLEICFWSLHNPKSMMALVDYVRLLLPKSSERDKIRSRAYARLPVFQGTDSEGSVTSEKSLSEREEDPLVSGFISNRSCAPKSTVYTFLPWVLVTMFATTTLLLLVHPFVSKRDWDFGSYEKGWSLEFSKFFAI